MSKYYFDYFLWSKRPFLVSQSLSLNLLAHSRIENMPLRSGKKRGTDSEFFAAEEAKLKAAKKGKKKKKQICPSKSVEEEENKEEEEEEEEKKNTEEEEEEESVVEEEDTTDEHDNNPPIAVEEEKGQKKVRRPRLTDITMQKEGSLSIRLSRDVEHWPVEAPMYTGRNPKCQLHRYLLDIDVRRNIVNCEVCRVALCPLCFKLYHKEERMVKKKKKLAEELKTSWLEHHPGKDFPRPRNTK